MYILYLYNVHVPAYVGVWARGGGGGIEVGSCRTNQNGAATGLRRNEFWCRIGNGSMPNGTMDGLTDFCSCFLCICLCCFADRRGVWDPVFRDQCQGKCQY